MKNAVALIALIASLAGAEPISISKSGQGPALVFIPGLGCLAEVWRAAVERLGFTREKVEHWLKEQYRAAPRLTIAVSDVARHFVMLDDPAWLADRIAGFSEQ